MLACSHAAGVGGVCAGMTAAEARARLPQLATTLVDPDAEARDLHEVAAACLQFTPRILLDPPGALLLDVTGCERAHGGLDALCDKARLLMQRLGFEARLAVAETATMACALALAPQPARDAADIPVWALRLPPADLQRLHALGLTRLDQLLALPVATLPGRFSPVLTRRLAQLRGEQPEEFPPFQPPARLSVHLPFSGPTDRRDTLLFALKRAADQLAETLCGLAAGATSLAVRLQAGQGAPCAFELEFSRPCADSRVLMAVLAGRFENIDTADAWFEGVTLEVLRRAPLAAQQHSLFEDPAPAGRPELLELVDELRSRLGPAGVRRAELVADPRPGKAWRLVEPPEPPRPQPVPAPGRPLAVFEPHRMQVTTGPDGLPQVWHEGRRDIALRIVRGPDRVEYGWWDDALARDYFEAEAADGSRLWLYRDQGVWFMNGTF